MIDRVSRDNALKRALKSDCCKIIYDFNLMNPTNFVIVRCLKSDADPFMLAEVCSVHLEEHSLKVHWWAPTPLSRSKQQFFHMMAFAAEMDKTQIKNRQHGASLWRLNPKVQTINTNTVHFGFNKLSSDSRLPPEVLRKLTAVNLISKNTKIKRL